MEICGEGKGSSLQKQWLSLKGLREAAIAYSKGCHFEAWKRAHETDFAFALLHFAFEPKLALRVRIKMGLAHFLHLKCANAALCLKMQELYYDLHYKYSFDMLHSALRGEVCISKAVGVQLSQCSLILSHISSKRSDHHSAIQAVRCVYDH